VVAEAGHYVVRVNARRRYPASGIVWSADGLIVTANHVVRHEDEIIVGLPGGDEVKATLVGRDPSTDLALLRVEAEGLRPATLRPATLRPATLRPAVWVVESDIRVGALVLAVGRPGANVEASLGILSAVGGAWRTGGGGKVSHFIKPDLVMYPGFSGGALVGGDGSVVGLVSSALLRDSGVALPVPTVKPVVETLLAHGHMGRGYLGVGVQVVRLPAPVAEELDQKTGLLITSVESDSPAEVGDLLVGDILVSFDGEPLRQPDDLSALLMGGRAGQTVNSRIVRGGVLQDRSLAVGQRS
jgi:S1-C subfamily serine protease